MTNQDQTTTARRDGGWRRIVRRIAPSQRAIEARELQRDARAAGCRPVAEMAERTRCEVAGTLRQVTLRPRSGTPALEAELYDGSGSVILVWLGRRRIAGIAPGAHLKAEGRISTQDGRRVIFNPRYELRA